MSRWCSIKNRTSASSSGESSNRDDALAKNPKLSEAQMKDVKASRAKGEELHKAGKHQESVDSLGKAKKILDIKD